jgi:hypothetical protein
MKQVAFALLLLLCPNSLIAQQLASSRSGPRLATVTLGVGNAMGWLGGQSEYYMAHERLSAFLGLGFTPWIEGDASGLTFAAGLRGYTRGNRHRGFLEISVSEIALESAVMGASAVASKQLYGPGLQAGYQYSALSGFTLMGSFGVGYALEGAQPLMGVGFGYTWR